MAMIICQGYNGCYSEFKRNKLLVYIIAETKKFIPSSSTYRKSKKRATVARECNGLELGEEATWLERRNDTSGMIEICLEVQMAVMCTYQN